MNETKSIQCKGTIYVVQPGDTMYKIAKKYRINMETIMQNNPYLNVFNLKPGDEMCLPLKTSMPIENVHPYVVKSQQSLLDILKETGVTFEELAKLNRGVRQITLPAGTILILPNKK